MSSPVRAAPGGIHGALLIIPLRRIDVKVVLFRIHLREDIDAAAYQAVFEQMLEAVSTISGFRGIEGFGGEDGSELAVAWFDSDEAIAEWKRHPAHLVAQERGRQEFFKSYEITVADTDRQYGWPADGQ
jgi:heme-degrading monooxygenase HmoA